MSSARSKNLEFAREEASHNLAERARLDMDQKAAISDVKRETDLLNRSSKEYNGSLKKCKRAEMQLQASQNQVPFMRRQLEEARRLRSERDAAYERERQVMSE